MFYSLRNPSHTFSSLMEPCLSSHSLPKQKKIPSLASHMWIEGESLGSVFLMEGVLRERKAPRAGSEMLPGKGA
jgi:hypothetical protein